MLALRAKSEALDNQVKTTLQSLAELRKELIAAKPNTPKSRTTRPVDYHELLSYAQRIAPYTVPPSRTKSMPAPIEQNVISTTEPIVAIKVEEPATPAPTSAIPGGDVIMADAPPSQPAHPAHLVSAQEEGKAVASLPDNIKAWLDPSTSGITFMPWPDNDMIRRGALSRIQYATEQGQDPGTMDIAAEDSRQDDVEGANGQNIGDGQDGLQNGTDNRNGESRQMAAQPGRVKEDVGSGMMDFDLYDPDED